MTLLCTPSPLPLCEPLSRPQSFLSGLLSLDVYFLYRRRILFKR